MRHKWWALFCALGFAGQLVAIDDCDLLFRQVLTNYGDEAPLLAFADAQADRNGQYHVAGLVPLLLELDRMQTDPVKNSEAIVEWIKKQNAHLASNASGGKLAKRLTAEQAAKLMAGPFVLDVPVPPQGISPFKAWGEKEETTIRKLTAAQQFPLMTIPRNIDLVQLGVSGTEVVQQGQFIKLPSGHILVANVGFLAHIPEGIWVSEIPVTQLQYAARMGDNPSLARTPSDKAFLRVGNTPVGHNRAVENVTPAQAHGAFTIWTATASNSPLQWKWGGGSTSRPDVPAAVATDSNFPFYTNLRSAPPSPLLM